MHAILHQMTNRVVYCRGQSFDNQYFDQMLYLSQQVHTLQGQNRVIRLRRIMGNGSKF